MDSDERRAIYERARDRARKTGAPMDEDPLFLGWVEEWIAGEIGIADLKRRYRELLRLRGQHRRIARISTSDDA